MATDEQWRWVVGYEGYYEVSTLGNVRGVDRVVERSDGVRIRLAGRAMKWHPHDGYPSVRLTRDSQSKLINVHRLVALAFLGQPGPGQEVCHNDGTRTNPALSNLRWGTRKENVADLIRHGAYVNPNSLKTHCKRGHSLEGCYVDPTHGQRICRICRRITRIARQRKRSGIKDAALNSGESC